VFVDCFCTSDVAGNICCSEWCVQFLDDTSHCVLTANTFSQTQLWCVWYTYVSASVGSCCFFFIIMCTWLSFQRIFLGNIRLLILHTNSLKLSTDLFTWHWTVNVEFFSVLIFVGILSLHDHDCSMSHLHLNAFHTLSYISHNKRTYNTVTKQKVKAGGIWSFIYENFFIKFLLVWTCRNLGKNIYNYQSL
jgi:hypothetical protein